MKFITCLIGALLLFCVVNAQNYTFYDTGAVWGQFYLGYFVNINDIQNTTMKHMSNDTINGEVYARVERIGTAYTGDYKRLMFRDSAGYVYRSYLDTTSGGPNPIKYEHLIYNFNLQVGDTFMVPQGHIPNLRYEVIDVSTVTLLDGSNRKQILLVDDPLSSYPDTIKWIEGIGDAEAGHRGRDFNIDSGWGLSCYSSANGIAVSNNYNYWPCDSNLLAGGYHFQTMFGNIKTQFADCGQSNGYIVFGAYGGNGPFTFWLNGNVYQNGDTLFGLPAGTYSVTIQGSTRSIQQSITLYALAGSNLVLDSVVFTEPTCGKYNGAITIYATGATQYSIYAGANSTPSNQFNNLRAGKYTLQITDNAGCILRQEVFLGEFAYPRIDSTKVVNVCNNVGLGSITVYTPRPGINLSYSVDSGQTYQASNFFDSLSAGSYTVIISDTAGCFSQPQYVEVVAGTVNTNTFALAGVIRALATDATYQWFYCDANMNPSTLLPGETGQSHTAIADGYYSVVVTDINTGCTDTSTCLYVLLSSTNDVNGLMGNISLYPNPNNGTFTIDLKQQLSGEIIVTNVLGQMVERFIFTETDKVNLILETEPSVYFVSIQTPHGKAVRRLIVE